jgi:hypothetical protein
MHNYEELKKYLTVGMHQILQSFAAILVRAKLECNFGHQSILDYKGLKKGSLSYANLVAIDPSRQIQLNGLLENHLANIQKQYAASPLYAAENGVIYELANGKPAEVKQAVTVQVEPKELTLEEVENQIKELNKLKKELKKASE